MQPILAESVPHRARMAGLAAALLVIAALALIPGHQLRRHGHLRPHHCKCSHGHAYVIR
ncbi:MAG TPA: hypothetical protein VFK02_34800 [Kofleriaceae bacterium]|nr:hypothetical protein [Kofleriaceae bacterium]